MKLNSGIYKIINIITNDFYIGSASFFNKRFNLHKHELRNNKHYNKHLQNSWNKYKEESFIFEIIELVEDKTKLIEREQHYIDLLKPYYNNRIIAHSQLGYKHSKESKLKMRNRMLNESLEFKEKLRISRNKVKQKPFLQYDKQMNFIKEWNNLQEYHFFRGRINSNVSAVLNGKRKTTDNYIFIYK